MVLSRAQTLDLKWPWLPAGNFSLAPRSIPADGNRWLRRRAQGQALHHDPVDLDQRLEVVLLAHDSARVTAHPEAQGDDLGAKLWRQRVRRPRAVGRQGHPHPPVPVERLDADDEIIRRRLGRVDQRPGHFAEEPVFGVDLPWTRQLVLVEHPELHVAPSDENSARMSAP